MHTDRRTFVKAGGLAAVLGTTGLAGCNLFGDGGGAAAGQSWQYDPATLGPSPNVAFAGIDYATLYENREDLPDSMADSFQQPQDVPIRPEDVDQLVGVAGGEVVLNTGSSADFQRLLAFGSTALTGDLPREDIAADLESRAGASQVGEYEGYTLYESPIGGAGVANPQFDGSGVTALRDDAVVAGVGLYRNADTTVSGRQAAEQMIDASAGDVRRLDETDGTASDLQGRVGDGTVSTGVAVDPNLVATAEDAGGDVGGEIGGTSQFVSGFRGGGLGADVDGGTADLSLVLVYESGSRARDSGVVSIVRALKPEYESQSGIEEVSASRDGAVITATIRGDPQAIAEQGQSAATVLDVAPRGR